MCVFREKNEISEGANLPCRGARSEISPGRFVGRGLFLNSQFVRNSQRSSAHGQRVRAAVMDCAGVWRKEVTARR